MNRAKTIFRCFMLGFAMLSGLRVSASPADLAEDLAALVAEGAGVLMPNLDEPHVEFRGIQPLSGDFPTDFQLGLSPVIEHGITVYPIAIRLDEDSGNAIFYNANAASFYTVPRIAPANWLALLHPLFPSNPWFAESRVIAQWTLVPEESLDDYLAASAPPPAPQLRSTPSPSGTLEVTNLMFTAISASDSNVVLDVAWPTNDIPPDGILDLYFKPDLATNVWTFLDSATPTGPTNATFTVDGADLPGFIHDEPPHVHDASCLPITNIIQSVFLPGEEETNIVYSCQTNPPAPPVAGFFRVGTRQDTDGDGLPDAYEWLVLRTDSQNADTDGDGLPDDAELLLSTDPVLPDTDGDGLGDGDEAGFVHRHPGFLWLETSSGTNLLTGMTSDVENQIWTVPLPSSVETGFGAFDRVSVDLDGAFHLLSPQSPAIPSSVSASMNLATWKPSAAATNEILFAVHAADLKAFATNSPQVLVANLASNQATVVEWRNVAHRLDGVPATFQAALLPEAPGRVFFSYLELPTGMVARAATIGAQDRRRHSFSSPSAFQNVAWARGASRTVENGMTLVLGPGTGTSPLLPDTDGDGLSDHAELGVYHTDPLQPDTDGDGLPDGAEVAVLLNPLSPDSDGDGMPDGWETIHGLAPQNPDDAVLDLDADGLFNVEEYDEGSDPGIPDSDGDGIPDFDETAHSRNRSIWQVPWFDLPADAILTPTNEVDDAVYSFPLAEPVSFCGTLCTNLLADSNGLVTFPAAARNGPHSSRNANVDLRSSTVWQHDCAVAAYWDDLKLRPTLGSAILAANVETNGETYCVVEYRDVGFYAAGGGSVTFQVSFAYGSPTNAVHVRYGDIADPRQGSSATFGIQGPNRFAVRQISFDATNAVAQSATTYLFGTGSRPNAEDTDADELPDAEEVALGTNPHLADSDGDGLPDAWEVANGLNPVSAVGDDGYSGDPDGDGRSNGSERSYGTSPVLCDTDGDGVPDGANAAAWSNHVLRATSSSPANLVVSYTATVPAGGSCALRIGTLTTPLAGSGTLELHLDPGTAYAFRLASTGGASASLSLLPPAAPPMRGVPATAGPPLWLDDSAGVFNGVSIANGGGTISFLTLSLRTVPEGQSECVHETPGIRTYEVVSTPVSWFTIQDSATIEGFTVNADGTLSLAVADEPRSVVTGRVTVVSSLAFFGSASVSATIHRCEGTGQTLCTLCASASGGTVPTTIVPQTATSSTHSDSRVRFSLSSLSPPTAIWTISPQISNGAHLHIDSETFQESYILEGVSDVWVSVGEVPQHYTISAKYDGCAVSSDTADFYVCRVEVDFADSVNNSWTLLPEEKVMLSNTMVRIRTRIEPMLPDRGIVLSLLGEGISMSTSDTCPDGTTIEIEDGDVLVSDSVRNELRQERTFAYLESLGLLPSGGTDEIDEKAWMDIGTSNLSANSNIADGLAFNSLSAEARGRSYKDGHLSDSPPTGPLHESFFQAAGREIATLSVCGTNSFPRQIMNQADWFYFSGHGFHATGHLQGGGIGVYPSSVINYWMNGDIDCVIFSACSVLDIGDRNHSFPDSDHSQSPGIDWANTGPRFFLGYNYTAPRDISGVPVSIISYWVAHKDSDGIVEAWMEANARNKAWNACAIDTVSGEYHYFKKGLFSHSQKVVNRGDW